MNTNSLNKVQITNIFEYLLLIARDCAKHLREYESLDGHILSKISSQNTYLIFKE